MGGGERDGDIGAVDKEAEGSTMPPTYDEAKGLTNEELKDKVKITPSDTKIEMGKEKEAEAEGFKGLSKEELMQYANDPYWVKLRWFLFIFFWVIWVAMLVASIVIIVYTPSCPSPDPKQWWQKAPIYKVEVNNFPDTNEDSFGDLNGVKSKLDYLVSAGVGTVYFSTLLSPHNFTEVEHKYGSMEEWANLANSLQERGIKVMADFNPGETSDKHMWQEESEAGNELYKNFYKAGSKNKLDLQNEAVGTELENVIKFWLTNGVDGLVINGVDSVPRTLMDKFRNVTEQEAENAGVNKILVAEDLNWENKWAGGDYTGVGAGSPVHLALSGDLIGTEMPTADQLKQKLDDFMAALPKELTLEKNHTLWPAFDFSSTAHGSDMVDALTMLKMVLPGTILTQSGEELGLPSLDFSKEEGEVEAKHLKLYSLLARKLRHQDSILFGKLTEDNTFVRNGTVFGLTRVKKGSPGYIFLVNFGNTNLNLDLSDVPKIAESIRVVGSGKVMAVSPKNTTEVDKFPSNKVALNAKQAKIFSFVPNFEKK